jgi:Uma2 family endonuclease
MSITLDEETWPQHLVLNDASWELYEQLLKEVGDQNLRLTYDDGVLEIMSPLPEHETVKKVVGGFIEIAALVLKIPMRRLGSTTFKRKSLRKGTEADECYYIQRAKDVARKKRIDLQRDPPPDLVLEVYTSYFTIDKRRIYAAMGVPEIWSYDGGELHILQLKRGKYEARETSAVLPFLKRADLQRFLGMLETEEETEVLNDWMDFVRANFVVDSR